MMLTELGSGEIPEVYRRFAEFVGGAHWRDRIKKVVGDNVFVLRIWHGRESR